MKRAERIQDGSSNLPASTNYTLRGRYWVSTGAESKWRQTGWSRKDQTKVRANNYVAPKAYALAA